jgi:hypothetical protein
MRMLKEMQWDFYGFRDYDNTDEYFNARFLIWAKKGPWNAPENLISFPFYFWYNPVDLDKLADKLGLEKGLLVEAAEAKGCVVTGKYAVPFSSKRRKRTADQIRKFLKGHGGAQPLSALPPPFSWGRESKLPEEMAQQLLAQLPFEVFSQPDDPTRLWVRLPPDPLVK